MKFQRKLGLTLFWGGFLAASVCMVLQREMDLLPADERETLAQLPEGFSIPGSELTEQTDQAIKNLTSEAFVSWVKELESKQRGQNKDTSESIKRSDDRRDVEARPIPRPTVAKAQIAADKTSRKSLTKEDLIKRRIASLPSLWSAVYWPGYLISAVVGICGAFLIRRSTHTEIESDVHRQAGLDQLVATLQSLNLQIDRLVEALPQLAPEETVAWIDTHCSPLCTDFAESRDLMKRAFGLDGFAAVMSDFASGERFLNRVWSAAADGYMEEAWRSLRTSQQFFHAAATEMLRRTG